MDFTLSLSGTSRTTPVRIIPLHMASRCYQGKALLGFSYAGAVPLQKGFLGKNSVTHSYALACRDVHENPQEREVRQETKTKKSRNCLRDLDLPYFMRNFLTDGAEGGTRTPTVLRPSAPQAGASANSATSAREGVLSHQFSVISCRSSAVGPQPRAGGVLTDN